MLFYKTIVIISFLCGASSTVEIDFGLSTRAQYLQANVTASINQLNATLESAFIPIDDFHSELSDVIAASLDHNDPLIQKYMHENQYKYWALVFRLLTDQYLAQLVKEYKDLLTRSKTLIKDIDDHGAEMEKILKKRGCNEEQIKLYLDHYFDKMHFLFQFELSYLDKQTPITNTIGSESFFVHKNIISFLYDCYDTSDLICYQNNEELFDFHVNFLDAKNTAFTTYQSKTIEKVIKFLDQRIKSSVSTYSEDVWTQKCPPDHTQIPS